MPKRYERQIIMDKATQEIMKDRMRFHMSRGKEFHQFLGTIHWKNETWVDQYNKSDDAIKDLLDLWYEVKEEV